MEIPYYIFLIVYAVILAFYGIFVFFSAYHLVRFGFFDFVAKVHTVMFTGVILVILSFTFILLRDVPWTESFPLFDQLSLNSLGI